MWIKSECLKKVGQNMLWAQGNNGLRSLLSDRGDGGGGPLKTKTSQVERRVKKNTTFTDKRTEISNEQFILTEFQERTKGPFSHFD